MTIWTAWEAPRRHQGGRKGALGQASWEAPERQERTNWTAREAPGRQGDNKDHLGSLGGRKRLIGQLARRQGGTREAGTLMFLACGFRFCV